MIHYHGTPITPAETLFDMAGRHFCVSYADHRQTRICHEIGQSVMLDNGAFSFWRAGKPTHWGGFFGWADYWLHYPTTWAVIPDVIDGSVEENDKLMSNWPFKHRGAPVWHLHEPIDRLLALVDEWPKVCFGSSGEYTQVGTPAWHERVSVAWDEITKRHRRAPWIHMLRGLSMVDGPYPFASADSTNIARNHATRRKTAAVMVDEIDRRQCPRRWEGDRS